jgi:hypothetical protein
MSRRSVHCLSTERFITAWIFIAIRGPTGLGNLRGHLDWIAVETNNLDRDVGGGVVRPCVRRRVQTVTGVIAGFVGLDLPDFKDVDLDVTEGRRQEHGCWFDRRGAFRSTKDLQRRRRAEQSVDDIEVGGCPVRRRKPAHHGDAAHDDRWRPDR